jgi:hypothetical protein
MLWLCGYEFKQMKKIQWSCLQLAKIFESLRSCVDRNFISLKETVPVSNGIERIVDLPMFQ